jgi:hypothetical protein
MVTAAMIAMFYLGTASGVMGAVLVSTSRSREAVVVPSLEDALPACDELRSAA